MAALTFCSSELLSVRSFHPTSAKSLLIYLNAALLVFESYAVDTTSLFSSPKLWPNLTVLVLRGLVFDPAAFNEFLKHHLSMEKLSVGWDVDLPPIDFETLSSNALPALQHFSFHGLRGEHVLPLLAYGRPLRELRGFAMRSEQDEPETVDGTEPLNFLTKLVDAKLPLQKLELEEWEGDRRANLALLARAVGETLVWLDLGSCLSTGKPVCAPFLFSCLCLSSSDQLMTQISGCPCGSVRLSAPRNFAWNQATIRTRRVDRWSRQLPSRTRRKCSKLETCFLS